VQHCEVLKIGTHALLTLCNLLALMLVL